MASIFNDFMTAYSKALNNIDKNDQNALFKIHNQLTMTYAMEAIKLSIEFMKDEKIDEAFDKWLEKYGGK